MHNLEIQKIRINKIKNMIKLLKYVLDILILICILKMLRQEENQKDMWLFIKK